MNDQQQQQQSPDDRSCQKSVVILSCLLTLGTVSWFLGPLTCHALNYPQMQNLDCDDPNLMTLPLRLFLGTGGVGYLIIMIFATNLLACLLHDLVYTVVRLALPSWLGLQWQAPTLRDELNGRRFNFLGLLFCSVFCDAEERTRFGRYPWLIIHLSCFAICLSVILVPAFLIEISHISVPLRYGLFWVMTIFAWGLIELFRRLSCTLFHVFRYPFSSSSIL